MIIPFFSLCVDSSWNWESHFTSSWISWGRLQFTFLITGSGPLNIGKQAESRKLDLRLLFDPHEVPTSGKDILRRLKLHSFPKALPIASTHFGSQVEKPLYGEGSEADLVRLCSCTAQDPINHEDLHVRISLLCKTPPQLRLLAWGPRREVPSRFFSHLSRRTIIHPVPSNILSAYMFSLGNTDESGKNGMNTDPGENRSVSAF